jgi:hypothetical protein
MAASAGEGFSNVAPKTKSSTKEIVVGMRKWYFVLWKNVYI